jgi:hypothetical protein
LLSIEKQVDVEKGLTEIEDKVREAVGKVVDPETGLTFAEMIPAISLFSFVPFDQSIVNVEKLGGLAFLCGTKIVKGQRIVVGDTVQ